MEFSLCDRSIGRYSVACDRPAMALFIWTRDWISELTQAHCVVHRIGVGVRASPSGKAPGFQPGTAWVESHLSLHNNERTVSGQLPESVQHSANPCIAHEA